MKRTFSDIVKIGSLQIPNRVVMAAMTRMRTNPSTGIPNDLMVQYYTQRNTAGLLLTECMAISKRGQGFPGAGNLYTKEQAEGWRKVVESVKKSGAVIFAQIFHAGRNSHPMVTGGLELWAPSAVAIRGRIPGQKVDYVAPKEVTRGEIEELKEEFRRAFGLAREAGFDGVQLHGANGYIIDEFIRSFSNQRTDEYGGSPQNRCRLALQLVDIAFKIWPKQRVSIKLSPTGRYGDMFDLNPTQTYTYLLSQLTKRGIGSIQLMRPQGQTPLYGHLAPLEQLPNAVQLFRENYKGVLIGNNGYSPETALKDIEDGRIDMVSFAKLFITNPDLYRRIVNGWPVKKEQDMRSWFGGGEKGYTDHPEYQL